MSEETGSTGSVAVVLQEEVPSFLKDGLDLKKLLRDLAKHSSKAVDKLVTLMSNDDPKIALQAARTLVEMQVQVAKDINSDQLQRLIAQAKLGSGQKQLIPVSGEGNEDRPVVDFTTIREIR